MSVEVLEGRQLLATITVNTTADSTGVGATLSLRQAIEVSDGTLAVSSLSTQEQAQVSGTVGTSNTIGFNIPTTDPGYAAATGVWTIAVTSALPTITTNAAIINGYSQPGALENTLTQGDNAKLAIALSGTTAGSNGLTIAQPGSQVRGLDIENFYEAGVVITAGGNVQVAGCFIGTDPTGEVAAPNGAGVILENSSNTIGGPNAADRNVLSGAEGLGVHSWENDGVYVPDQASNPLNIAPFGNVVENNIIGLDATGTKAIENHYVGVNDSGAGNTYGGTTAGLGNVISGNFEGGLNTSGNVTIEGNYIGTDVTGKVAIGNGLSAAGIFSAESATATSISMTISDNVVSGNYDAIYLDQTVGSQSSYTIADNLIGTDASGTVAIGNKGIGLDLTSVENATVLDNVISANETGIRTQTTTPSGELQHDVFQGNLIGTDKTGQVAMGNTIEGIDIESGTGITIGGTGSGQGNVIANSGYYGIYLPAGQQIQFTQNSIFGNAKGGFFRGEDVNELIIPPALTFAPGTGSTGTLSGTLTEAKNTSYDVEIFSNPTAQSGEGETFVQDVTVTTDGTGQGTFSVSEPIGFYTATATDPIGDTSDFSAVAVTLAASLTTVSSSANPSTPGQPVTFTAVVTAPSYLGTPTGTVIFTIDGQAQTPVALSVVGSADEVHYVTSTLAAGQHSVTAAYSGDTNVGPSSGSLPTQTVTSTSLSSTTTTLTSSANPSTPGQQVTFTAVVTAAGFSGTPTGTVTFAIDGQAQTPVALSVVGGVDEAQFVTSTLTVGQHAVTAAYSGETTLSPSSVSLPTQTVNSASLQSTTTTLTSSLNPSTPGQQVTFTADVATSGVTGTPTGTVTFTVDGVPQPPVSVQLVKGIDVATISISTLVAGNHSIEAAYNGDTAFSPSDAPVAVMETVNGSTTTTTSVSSTVDSTANTAPEITRAERFGYHMHPTFLVLFFNEGLDSERAQDAGNYQIIGPSGQHIGIRSAFYNAMTQTVTLSPDRLIDFHHNYRLTVNGKGSGGVDDRDETLLDGIGDGDPGSDYVTTLNWRNLVFTQPGKSWRLPLIYTASPASPHGPLVHRSSARHRAVPKL
jgi:Bacterial Ig-like domain (group 3)